MRIKLPYVTLLCSSLFFHLSISAQTIQIVDAETGLGIPFVEIRSAEPKVLGYSDLDGMINTASLTLEMDTVYLHHFTYTPAAIPVSEFIHAEDHSIILQPFSYALPSVTVTAQENDWMITPACFRSIQYNDDTIKYYSEGHIRYVTSTKGKRKVKGYIVDNLNSLENGKLNDQQIVRSFTIVMNKVGVSSPQNEYLPYNWTKLGIDISEITHINGINVKNLVLDNKTVGKIEEHKEYHKVYINVGLIEGLKSWQLYQIINIMPDIFIIFNVWERKQY